jgi:integrase
MATTPTLLQQQAEVFLSQIETRRRSPVKASTARAYRVHLNAWILPLLGSEDLAKVENGVVKAFLRKLSEARLAPATINAIFSTLKQVVASAVDENGNQLYQRVWNPDFIDLPVIAKASQTTPVSTPQSIQEAISRAKGQERALYALLAGSGLRVGEALALRYGPDNGKDSYWAPETGVLIVRTTLNTASGAVQDSPKTEAGKREVDICPELNEFLCALLTGDNTPSQALVFQAANGGPVRFNTLRDHALQSGIDPRFHALRRFRITHMESVGVPSGLQRFWSGHAAKDTHESYIRMGEKIQERKEWAVKAGLGFKLEAV